MRAMRKCFPQDIPETHGESTAVEEVQMTYKGEHYRIFHRNFPPEREAPTRNFPMNIPRQREAPEPFSPEKDPSQGEARSGIFPGNDSGFV